MFLFFQNNLLKILSRFLERQRMRRTRYYKVRENICEDERSHRNLSAKIDECKNPTVILYFSFTVTNKD